MNFMTALSFLASSMQIGIQQIFPLYSTTHRFSQMFEVPIDKFNRTTYAERNTAINTFFMAKC